MESPSRRTPNQTPSQRVGVEYAFLENNVNGLRARQQDILNDDSIEDDEKMARVEALIAEYLGDFGVAEDADNRAGYEAVLRKFSADKVGNSKWRYGDWNATAGQNEGKRGRDLLHDEQVRLFGRALYEDELDSRQSPGTSDTEFRELTFDEWTAQKGGHEAWYSEISKKYAELAADRSGKLFERRKGKNRKEIDGAKEEATDMLNALATQMMDELEAQGKSPDEIAESIENFVNTEADKLMGNMENHRIEQYEKSGRARKWFYDKWAKWTDESTDKETGKKRFFSKGNFKKMLAMAGAAAPIAVGTGLAVACRWYCCGCWSFCNGNGCNVCWFSCYR